MGIMAKTDLTNQRQVFVEEYVRSGDHLKQQRRLDTKTRIHLGIRPVSSAESVQMKQQMSYIETLLK